MSLYNPEIHHRKSIRLKGFDYAKPGYYFVTINIGDLRCMLAGWKNGLLRLTPIGGIVQKYWLEIPAHYPNVGMDEYIIMPDHVHGIIQIINDKNGEMVGARHGVPLQNENVPIHRFQKIVPKSIGMIINQFKSSVTRWCRANGYPQFKWQRNYHEHIIRNDEETQRIRKYIRNNPAAFLVEFPGLKGQP